MAPFTYCPFGQLAQEMEVSQLTTVTQERQLVARLDMASSPSPSALYMVTAIHIEAQDAYDYDRKKHPGAGTRGVQFTCSTHWSHT